LIGRAFLERSDMSDIRGITLAGAQITGKEPVGAALSVGVKGLNGQPINKDRFYIVQPQSHSETYRKRDGGTYNAEKRDLHPSFAQFNDDEKTPADRRRTIPVRIMHAREWNPDTDPPNGCFWYAFQAFTLGNKRHPRNKPMCEGDGIKAERWVPAVGGGELVKKCIECPGKGRCPYTVAAAPKQGQTYKPKAECGMKMTFVARFDWPRAADGRGFPNMPFKYKSGGEHMVYAFVGFFDAFRRICLDVGVPYEAVNLVGFPAMLQLSEKTSKEDQTRFPVVYLVPRYDEVDILGWIGQQATRIRQLQDQYAPHGAPLLTTDDDYDLISPTIVTSAGNIPG